MVLIAVGLALLVNQLAGGLARYRPADWIVRWFRAATSALSWVPGIAGTRGLVLLLAVPLLPVGLVQYWLAAEGHGLLQFVLACGALIYCWGPANLDEEVDQILAAESEGDARLRAETMLGHGLSEAPDSWCWEAARGVFRQSLRRWFGVLFWFLMLGAVGALLYRLGDRVARCDDELAAGQIEAARRLVAILNAPAALLTALGVAIVSDFDAIIAALKRHLRRDDLLPALLSARFVEEVGEAAVRRRLAGDDALESDVSGPRRRIALAMSMVWRTLVVWLAVLAAAVIAGWIA